MNGHRGGYELHVTAVSLWLVRVEIRTYRRKSVRKIQVGIILVHSATEIVWRRRTRGILAGTKLEKWRGIYVFKVWKELRAKFDFDRTEWTYSTRA